MEYQDSLSVFGKHIKVKVSYAVLDTNLFFFTPHSSCSWRVDPESMKNIVPRTVSFVTPAFVSW
jgi:hypothetical protein